MKEKLNQIIELANEINAEISSQDTNISFNLQYGSLELPDILSSIIELLQPQLLPNELAIYFHLFNNSILKFGVQYTRVSVRGLQAGTIKSSSGQSESLAYATVKECLDGLEKKGAIEKQGDPNREGTLYKVNIPDEIEICQIYKKNHEEIEKKEVNLKNLESEIDFYNIKENRLKIFERDLYKCTYCNKQLTRFSATLDHIQPISQGGDNSFGNLKTACLHCNSTRGAAPVSDFIIKSKEYL
ncbi:HNH endonuclease [Leptospira noumeaensis]|uniref:HNH endonuclease n=1 Tax=Leptospira noumeaensis TaxID=2484964 RepID=A0A4R9IJ97_9LEPT|nr:HNH endonuclease signature motif containing protein [Leptospira noumeaensis]TGK89261.1 HNH endonuclease [Leptospira noumeaensis]